MNKNYLITTGGSGGHVIPAIILYEHLSRDAKVIITTDKRGLKYLNDKNYQLRIIDTPKLNNVFLLPINFHASSRTAHWFPQAKCSLE